MSTNWYSAVDLFIDFIFFLDILLRFNMSFYDSDGNEIIDRIIIAKNYAFKV